MSGWILYTDSLNRLKERLLSHAHLKPVDLLAQNYFGRLNRDSMLGNKNGSIMAYRYSLFTHIGSVSSIGNHRSDDDGSRLTFGLECQSLLTGVLSPFEQFEVGECLLDDMSPCSMSALSLPPFFATQDASTPPSLKVIKRISTTIGPAVLYDGPSNHDGSTRAIVPTSNLSTSASWPPSEDLLDFHSVIRPAVLKTSIGSTDSTDRGRAENNRCADQVPDHICKAIWQSDSPFDIMLYGSPNRKMTETAASKTENISSAPSADRLRKSNKELLVYLVVTKNSESCKEACVRLRMQCVPQWALAVASCSNLKHVAGCPTCGKVMEESSPTMSVKWTEAKTGVWAAAAFDCPCGMHGTNSVLNCDYRPRRRAPSHARETVHSFCPCGDLAPSLV
eukprot:Filipodium_phascolosomae@DN5766_c0_g1_i1.p1